MNRTFLFHVITFFIFLSSSHVYGEETCSEIIFRAQTQKEECDRIKYTLLKLGWYAKNGYRVILPYHESFEALYLEAKSSLSGISDGASFVKYPYFQNEEQFWKIFYSEIYDPESYVNGVKLLSAGKEDIEKALKKFTVLQKNWGFKLMPKYQILLTLYGVGGSYEVSAGNVIVLTTPEGQLGSLGALGLPIHEMVHIGIEEDIVQKFHLTHWEKEHLVDSICALYLKNILPEYKYQKVSETIVTNMATFINEETIVHNLPLAISNFVKAYPR